MRSTRLSRLGKSLQPGNAPDEMSDLPLQPSVLRGIATIDDGDILGEPAQFLTKALHGVSRRASRCSVDVSRDDGWQKLLHHRCIWFEILDAFPDSC
jgi:hypothetical protein